MNVTQLEIIVTEAFIIEANKRLDVAFNDEDRASITGEIKAYNKMKRYFNSRLAAENRILQGK